MVRKCCVGMKLLYNTRTTERSKTQAYASTKSETGRSQNGYIACIGTGPECDPSLLMGEEPHPCCPSPTPHPDPPAPLPLGRKPGLSDDHSLAGGRLELQSPAAAQKQVCAVMWGIQQTATRRGGPAQPARLLVCVVSWRPTTKRPCMLGLGQGLSGRLLGCSHNAWHIMGKQISSRAWQLHIRVQLSHCLTC
jgi:hypothetical protein